MSFLEAMKSLTSKEKDAQKFLIYGHSGSGKTLLATSLGETSPGILLDTPHEMGWATVQGAPYAGNIMHHLIDSPRELRPIIQELKTTPHSYKWLTIDSWTAYIGMVYEVMYADTAKTTKGAIDTRAVWGRVLTEMREITKLLYKLSEDTGMAIIGTAQETTYKDEGGLAMRAYPAISGQSQNLLTASADYVLYTFCEGSPSQYKVRLKPGDACLAKLRMWPEQAQRIPEIVPTKQGTRFTLTKYLDIVQAVGKEGAR